MSLQKNLRNSINTIYHEKDQSITAFADELCISRACLYDILSGDSNPRIGTITHIAEHLNVDPLSLLSCSQKQIDVVTSMIKFLDAISLLEEGQRRSVVSLVHQIMFIISK